jgi:adenylosuccinate lyase
VRPLKELGAKWVASHEAAVATKMVYNSFKRSSPLVRRESRIQQSGRQAAEVIEGEDVAVAGRESEASRSDHHQRTRSRLSADKTCVAVGPDGRRCLDRQREPRELQGIL